MELKLVTKKRLPAFKNDLKRIFKDNYEDLFNESAEDIVKDSDIEAFFSGSTLSFEAIEDDHRIGGIIFEHIPGLTSASFRTSFSLDVDRHEEILTFLYDALEEKFPDIKCWISYGSKFDEEHTAFLKKRGFRVAKRLTRRNFGPAAIAKRCEPKEKSFIKLVKRID